MADTVVDEIAELKARLTVLTAKRDKIESMRSVEEGSSGSRFKTEFTDISKIYDELDRVKTRLRTLEVYNV